LGQHTKHGSIRGRLVRVGLGSIAQAVLPLILRHIDIRPDQLDIVAADDNGRDVARAFGVKLTVARIDAGNYRQVLVPLLGPDSFLLNLSVNVSSKALIELCRELNVLYLDTCIEPWAGGYVDASLTPSQRSNYALREDVLALRGTAPSSATSIVTMGANPGLASAFVKQAIVQLIGDSAIAQPRQKSDWAAAAGALGIRAIHIAERDTQVTSRRKERGEFVNTWSVDGFVSEGLQPAELGWGTHEKHFPSDGARHHFGRDSAIYLSRPGASTRVRSWTPLEGAYEGFLITHGESITISDFLTVKQDSEVTYRPTVHYAYHPCDDAVLSLHEMAGKHWMPQTRQRIIRDEISSGTDELGVLLMGDPRGVYWYGSRLDIETARSLAPYNSSTSLQVAAGVLAGMVWALHHPTSDILEPEDLDHEAVMQVAGPYLGEVRGQFGDWTPLEGRERLFAEDIDRGDPWQFRNVRVS
jgi:homospermidine synthase